MKKLLIIIPLALILCFMVGCQDKATMAKLEEFNAQAAVEEQNKDLVQSWAEAVNHHDFDKMDELMDEDYIWHFPGRDVISRNNVKVSFTRLYQGFPDIQLIPEDIISKGDKVVVRWNIRGTHNGEYLGVKPTGKLVHYPSISIDKIVNGKFAEGWEIYDALGLMQQLGMELKPKEEK